MRPALTKTEIEVALAGIRNSLAEADKIAAEWNGLMHSNRTIDEDERAVAEHYVREAFIQTVVLLEAVDLDVTLQEIRTLNQEAKTDYSKLTYHEDFYLEWSYRLGQYLDGVENALVGSKTGTVTKDLIQILRGTLHAITDVRCFASPPQDESQVHNRIEAVLRCVFPDLRHKPPISKPIKNFQPDTGLPSLRTLIEYKYISSLEDAKIASDQVLADTRAYTSKDWDTFVYVIYETTRIKKEEEWIAHLRENGVGDETKIIVLPGEAILKSTVKRQRGLTHKI